MKKKNISVPILFASATFLVTFGRPVLIQKDANGEIYLLLDREKP